jgi:hypothetical protein
MNGVFLRWICSSFYVFFEVMLLPMYFLIAVWGGADREYAAIKFLLYTLFGSVFILVAILSCISGRGRRWSPTAAVRGAHLRHGEARPAPRDGLLRAVDPGVDLPAVPDRLPREAPRRSRSTPGCPTPTSRRPRRSR